MSRSERPSFLASLVRVGLLLIAGVVFWHHGLPWLQKKFFEDELAGSSEPNAPKMSCANSAGAAIGAWRSGIDRFTNPPYDHAAWERFSSEVARRIRQTKQTCDCRSESCLVSKKAMKELGALRDQLDAAIRSGVGFSNETARRVDDIAAAVEEAGKLERRGK